MSVLPPKIQKTAIGSSENRPFQPPHCRMMQPLFWKPCEYPQKPNIVKN